jgi:ketosteroid isomerase-like protein
MTATDTFFSAWSEADDAARLAIIRDVVTDGCTYDDPRSPGVLTGDAAIADYVGNFARMAVGASVVVVKTDLRGACERATIAFRMADGMEQTGQYFIDHDGDKIARVVGFVGTGADS